MRAVEAVPEDLVGIVVALCLTGAGVHRQQQAIAAALDRGRSPDPARLLRAMYGDLRDRPSPAEVADARAALAVRDIDVLIPGAPGYPRRLGDAWPDLGAPLWLFRAGPQPAMSPGTAAGAGPAVAVVGTRLPTADGIRVAEALAGSLAAAGGLVVSGMARGIDQAAHRAVLAAGGRTAAVLGTGHGVDYPRGSEDLRNAVTRSAGLYSEVLPGTPPKPHRFLERNRIISGLADAIVVVEGRARSGALQTARLAAAQGRDVWAVPGSINAPASQAPLALIRDGAQVLTRVEDLLEAVGLPVANEPAPAARPDKTAGADPSPPDRSRDSGQLSADDAAVLELLGTVAVSVDEIVTRTGQPAARVLATLGRLRRLGLADADPTGVVATPSST